jgi:hypothetical protein
MQTPIPKGFISTFIFKAILTFLLLILAWVTLLSLVTQSKHDSNADVQIIFPFGK